MPQKKVVLAFLALAMVLSLVLYGCQPASPAEASAKGASNATEEKEFAGIKVVFFPGGSEGDTFATVVYAGAVAAQKDLGCDVEYVWSNWDPNTMVNQFKEAIARVPDGIAVMGHPGVDALSPLVDEAESKGIIVTSQNTDLPAIEAKYKTSGFGYVGQELYASGVTLAKGAAQRAGLQSGDRVMVWGLAAQPTRGERTKGCVDAFNELGMTVDYIEISPEINADAAQGTPVVTSYLSAHPDCKMVVTDHGNLTSTLGTYLQAANKKPGEIFGAGFDLSASTAKAIQDGWVGAVLDQQPWLQGYLPVLQICLSKKYGFSGLHIDTGAAIIDSSNIGFIAPLADKKIR